MRKQIMQIHFEDNNVKLLHVSYCLLLPLIQGSYWTFISIFPQSFHISRSLSIAMHCSCFKLAGCSLFFSSGHALLLCVNRVMVSECLSVGYKRRQFMKISVAFPILLKRRVQKPKSRNRSVKCLKGRGALKNLGIFPNIGGGGLPNSQNIFYTKNSP